MYMISVPITNHFSNREIDREKVLSELKRIGAGRVFLCTCRGIADSATKSAELESLRENIRYFEDAGLEVAVWMSSLGHGGTLLINDNNESFHLDYQKMVSLDGTTCDDTFCPLDERYADTFAGWIRDVAGVGAKMIMLDDDYRLSYRTNGMSCCCDLHMERYQKLVQEKVSREELKAKIFTGGSNKYRDAWLSLCGDTLKDLARLCRKYVDEVDTSVRLGFCSVLSTWDVDGVDAISLAKVFAGNTRPFLRGIGAPYWNVANNWGTRLGQIIELQRMQEFWCRKENIELFSEGDVYPRPRYATPASYLECFDMALQASGGFDGILKYVLDYGSSPYYERGYIDRALRNRPTYEWINKHFSQKTSVGVEPICKMDCLREAQLPPNCGEDYYTDGMFFRMAHRLLCDNSIPVTYGGDGVCVAFGENARALTEEHMKRGLIIDMVAARVLMEQGVDVGIEKAEASSLVPGCEHFIEDDEYVTLGGLNGFYEVTTKDGAMLQSELIANGKAYVGAFRYVNSDGHRFVVYPFDAYYGSRCLGLFRSYERQKTLVCDINWLGEKLPVSCLGNPDLYLLAKKDNQSMTVGMWNLHEDVVLPTTVQLDAVYREVKTFNCEGYLKDDMFILTSEIQPFAFAGIELML